MCGRPVGGAGATPPQVDEDYRIKVRRIATEEALKAAVHRGVRAAGHGHEPVRAYEDWAATNLPVEDVAPVVERIAAAGRDEQRTPISPSHYADGWSNGAEVIDITENLNFNRGNAVKYIARAGKKDPSKQLEDLRKAEWYLQREIARLELQR